MKPESTRAEVLRDILVERVERTPERRGSRRRGVVALVIAFAAGALLAGGALSATALVATQSDDFNDHYDTLGHAEAGGRSYMGTHDPMVGEPFELVADASAELLIGRQPEGATALVFGMSCVGEGEVSVAIDGSWDGTLGCDAGGGGSASYARLSELSDSHTVSADITSGNARYAVWAAWVVKQEEPVQSQAQVDALSDGVVTYDEFRTGFDRYAACLLAAGFDIHGTENGKLMDAAIPGEAVDSGADMACYVAEFRQLDIEWQTVGQYLATQQ